MSNRIIFTKSYDVSFGNCDPAGIVYYPNFFSWLDQTFHAFLEERFDGHAKLCKMLEARGLGLITADAQFKSPAFPGDILQIEMQYPEWSNRSATIFYTGKINDTLAIEGKEVRGIFADQDGKMIAKPVADLREMFDRTLNE